MLKMVLEEKEGLDGENKTPENPCAARIFARFGRSVRSTEH
jgi:hypothetical protein